MTTHVVKELAGKEVQTLSGHAAQPIVQAVTPESMWVIPRVNGGRPSDSLLIHTVTDFYDREFF